MWTPTIKTKPVWAWHFIFKASKYTEYWFFLNRTYWTHLLLSLIISLQCFRGSLLSTSKVSLTKQFIGCPGSSCKLISSVTFLKYTFGKYLYWRGSVRKLDRFRKLKLLVGNFSVLELDNSVHELVYTHAACARTWRSSCIRPPYYGALFYTWTM